MDAQPDKPRNRALIGVSALAALLAVVLTVVVLSDDDDDVVGTEATTTSADTTTTVETTTTEGTTTTAISSVVDPAAPLFPDPDTSRRFDDPVAVATVWATDVVGFTDPVVGPFQSGDSRSGEVEVRSFAAGAPTVVLVRQLQDDTWFVIGAATDSIRIAEPAAGATISSPQTLAGAAYAFEGTVNVRLYADGVAKPIAETFVTGRGDGVLGNFSGSIEFVAPPGARFGVLLLLEASAKDGGANAVAAIRVAF